MSIFVTDSWRDDSTQNIITSCIINSLSATQQSTSVAKTCESGFNLCGSKEICHGTFEQSKLIFSGFLTTENLRNCGNIQVQAEQDFVK